MIDLARRVFHQPRPTCCILLAILLGWTCGCGKSQHGDGPSDSDAVGNEDAGRGVVEQVRPENVPPIRYEDWTGTSNVDAANATVAGVDHPDGVLVYPGAIQVESLRIASKGSEVKAPPGVAMFVSPEPDLKQVATWYENELVSAGWAVAERDDEYSLFQKAGRELSVSVTALPEPKPDGHADAHLLIVIDAN